MLLLHWGIVFPKSQLKIQTKGYREFTRIVIMGKEERKH